MKPNRLLWMGLLMLSAPIRAQNQPSNLSYVDPTIGGVGLILEPTRPTVHLPNSMVRVLPARKDQLDDQISYFPLTITSHRQPSVFGLLPVSGPISEPTWNQRLAYDQEMTTPYYYSVRWEDSGDELEFSPAARSGYFRFRFVGKQAHALRLGVLNGKGEILSSGKRILSGSENVSGLPCYFYGELNRDVISSQYHHGADKKELLVKLDEQVQTVDFRYGISFISIEQAKANLQKEIPGWDFDSVKQQAKQAWQKVLSQVNVNGGTEAQKRVFYTSLYRCYERMVDINEYGKYYSAFDHQVHQSKEPFFVDNWLWDTYIALEPLQAIFNPDRQAQKIRSYVQMYEQSGWMPSFALAFGDNPCMTGNHAAAWITDSWMKGIRNFDLKKAYEGLRKNSLQATLLPWRNGPASPLDAFYNQKGYMPALKPGERETVTEVDGFERRQAVAVTLENSYDDWCLAQLAPLAGQASDRALFLKRAANYRNVFRAEKGFVWPKDGQGNWIEPFDPAFSGGQGGRDYFTENNAYTYNWDVKHDLKGLLELMGGRQKAEERLDELFRAELGRSKYDLWYTFPDATGLVGQFVMGNEPSFHIPYLYNYTGSPWKTQKRIRQLLDTWYTDNLFGIPGDEDGGGMTAFVVFSMMGFFPVTPGIPIYTLGSPVFTSISISLPNGKIFAVQARNSSPANKYIQSATFNGQPLDKPWFTHQQLLQGGELSLTMGDQPNKQWGSKPEDAYPSALDFQPEG